MNNEYKDVLGDFGFALLPNTFMESITKHCKYDYKNEKIDNVLEVPVGKLGKFWKFIDGVEYLQLLEDNTIVIQQSENQKRACLVPLLYGVEKVAVKRCVFSKKYKLEKSIFKGIGVCVIDLNFKKPIKKITLYFNQKTLSPLKIKIKTLNYKEPEIDYRQELIKNMNVAHSVGQDLVTITFQKAVEKIKKTKISLYIIKNEKPQLLSNYEVEKDIYFKTITGLAYDKYSYKVTQYDKNNKLVIETDFMNFDIRHPLYGFGNGKPTIMG